MKEKFKPVIFNILIIFLLFLCVEIFSYCKLNFLSDESFSQKIHNCLTKFEQTYCFKGYHYDDNFRQPIINNDAQNGIILMGCSFANGYSLPENKNFESFLNKSLIKKNYNIYNVSVPGGCQKEALYLLKSNIISNFIKKYQPNIGKSEFIYTYIYQQKNRLFYNDRMFVPSYKEVDSSTGEKLVLQRNTIFQQCQTVNFLKRWFILKHFSNINYCQNYGNKLVLLYFEELNSEIKKQFKNSELVVFVFDGEKSDFAIWENLRKEGINVIFLSELTDKKIYAAPEYTIADGWHPNEKAWELVSPLIAKKLNL